MNSKEIVVKNKPVYVDKFFGKRIRSMKRLINTQGGIKSKPIEVQVKKEPSTDDESSTDSSHKCKICKMRFVNLRSLNKHSRVHVDEEEKNSDEKSKEKEAKSELSKNVRSKQESTRETGYMKQQSMKRRNKSTFMPSISLLKHEPTEPQTVDNRSRKSKKTNKRK